MTDILRHEIDLGDDCTAICVCEFSQEGDPCFSLYDGLGDPVAASMNGCIFVVSEIDALCAGLQEFKRRVLTAAPQEQP